MAEDRIFINTVIGSDFQVEQIEKLLTSGKSELVVIYGRRRVGETYLIRETYKKMLFDVAGIPDGGYKEQLANFYNEICKRKKTFAKRDAPNNWLEAFGLLRAYIDSMKGDKKKVVFIDEFPWMYTHKFKPLFKEA